METLLSVTDKRGVDLGLFNKPVDINDTRYLSSYFVIQEFNPILTAGKNSISFNGSTLLKQNSEIQVECIDSAGLSLYIESTTKSSLTYKDSSKYILSIHVYNEASNGPGKLILYGTTIHNQTVKWVGNISIDKSKQNSSIVRFYNKPTLEINPVLSPVVANTTGLTKTIKLTGSFHSNAVNPLKDSLQINKRNVDIDYRIFSNQINGNTDPSGSFNSQMIGSKIDIHVKTIQDAYSYKNKIVNYTSSLYVKDIINNSTLKTTDVFFYPDYRRNDVVTNIVDGNFSIEYPYIIYNTSSESSNYLTSNTTNNDTLLVKQSYADIIYRNIKTFTGFIARHKLYRKSFSSTGDFEIVSDEPLVSYELLKDNLTNNKLFDKMGYFYNQSHIGRYWFKNGSLLELTQSSVKLNESLIISCPSTTYNNLDSYSNYVILKDNSSFENRNSIYFPFNLTEFTNTSGSSYDCNFIEIKKDVNYLLSLNAILTKDSTTINDDESGLEFYFTSSLSDIKLERGYIPQQPGLLKIGIIPASDFIKEKTYNPTEILFSVAHDLYGTLVIIPRKCVATISQLSLKSYGDYGFSPDSLITRIPFPVNVANESFEIKAELFDINSNLVYSDLKTTAVFDPSGSSLASYISTLKDPSKTAFISGSLQISQSLYVNQNLSITGSATINGTVYIPNIEESTYVDERVLSWNPTTGEIRYTNINDIDHINNDEITMTLYEKNSTTKNTPFRLIPSVKGRNIFVPKKQGLLE